MSILRIRFCLWLIVLHKSPRLECVRYDAAAHTDDDMDTLDNPLVSEVKSKEKGDNDDDDMGVQGEWRNQALSTMQKRAKGSMFETFDNVCITQRPDFPHWGNTGEHVDMCGQNVQEVGEAGAWIHNAGACGPQPGESMVEEPTMILTAPPTNPNHQLMDVLWKVYPLLHGSDSFPVRQVWLPMDPTCRTHLCKNLNALYTAVFPGQALHVLAKDSKTCFAKVVIPTGIASDNDRLNTLLREAMTSQFVHPQHNVLIYGHEDSEDRNWRNVKSVAKALQTSGYSVNYSQNLSLDAVTVEEQCRAFWDADVLIFPHGGHEANMICSRPGTRILEIACASSVGWFQSAAAFHELMGFQYKYQQANECSPAPHSDKGGSQYNHFEFLPDRVLQWMSESSP